MNSIPSLTVHCLPSLCVQEVANHGRSILQRFLTDLIEEQANGCLEDGQLPEPSHGAVIILLREILRQFLVSFTFLVIFIIYKNNINYISFSNKKL